MAVTEWEVINPGVTTGHPQSMRGVVVNGGTTGTGPSPMPTSGRGYPRT